MTRYLSRHKLVLNFLISIYIKNNRSYFASRSIIRLCIIIGSRGIYYIVRNHWKKVNQTLPHKAKTQYVHCILTANCFLYPWRNPAEISRRLILFHN